MQGEPMALVTNSIGLKRMLHMECAQEAGLFHHDDD